MDTPSGPWRAPFSNTHAFVSQCFINELAEAGGRDHVELLIEMMGEPRWLEPKTFRAMNTERAIGVIKLAAEKGGGAEPCRRVVDWVSRFISVTPHTSRNLLRSV
ncbi:MAG: hypothetical protein CM15mP120_18710 [Pseudomonadota bacterium]|nr:MAG: hypothetical protein CM15mP120_18710 [Pseudomonadota bacterium]